MKFLNARKSAYHTDAKLIDEVIYTPYTYQPADTRQSIAKPHALTTGDLLGVPELRPSEDRDPNEMRTIKKKSKFDATPTHAEIFLFEYGTVVIWGMTEAQERRFLSSLYVCSTLDDTSSIFVSAGNASKKTSLVRPAPLNSVCKLT